MPSIAADCSSSFPSGIFVEGEKKRKKNKAHPSHPHRPFLGSRNKLSFLRAFFTPAKWYHLIFIDEKGKEGLKIFISKIL